MQDHNGLLTKADNVKLEILTGEGTAISNRKLIALIGLLLVLALLAGTTVWLLYPRSARVVITVAGAEYGSYDLRENQVIPIVAEDSSWYNILEIRDGTASVIESDCNNQICVHTPPLSEDTVGIIVCLPHGVAVELK